MANHLAPNVTKRRWSLEEDESKLGPTVDMVTALVALQNYWRVDLITALKAGFYTTSHRRITTPSAVNKRSRPSFQQKNIPSEMKRKRPANQQPSEQVGIMNRVHVYGNRKGILVIFSSTALPIEIEMHEQLVLNTGKPISTRPAAAQWQCMGEHGEGFS